MGLSLGAAPHRLLLVVVLLGAPAGPADGFVWSSASRNQTLARAEEVVPLRAASQGPAVATREASPSNPVSLPLPADAASLPRGKGFDTFEEVQGRCFGAPYPLVFGKRVRIAPRAGQPDNSAHHPSFSAPCHPSPSSLSFCSKANTTIAPLLLSSSPPLWQVSLPEVEINEEIRAKKQAIGFFGSSVKNPGGKNEGTTADRVLKNLLKVGSPSVLSLHLLPSNVRLVVFPLLALAQPTLCFQERGMRGGSRGSAKPRNLLGQHAAAEDPEDAKDEVGQPLGGRRSGAGVPGTGEMLRGGGGRRQLAGKADSLPLVRFCAKERAAKHLRPGEEAIEQCILKPHTVRTTGKVPRGGGKSG